MLSPNEGYNETGLTMQSAGPVARALAVNSVRVFIQR